MCSYHCKLWRLRNSVKWPPTLGPSQLTSTMSPPVGCWCPHPPQPFISTQSQSFLVSYQPVSSKSVSRFIRFREIDHRTSITSASSRLHVPHAYLLVFTRCLTSINTVLLNDTLLVMLQLHQIWEISEWLCLLYYYTTQTSQHSSNLGWHKQLLLFSSSCKLGLY